MRTLDFAIKIENWELAALCLATGWFEAMNDVPEESIDELMDALAGPPFDIAPAPAGRQDERTRRVEEFAQEALRRANAIQLSPGFEREVRRAMRGEKCVPRRHGRLRGHSARGAG